jgi:hypothetical protein
METPVALQNVELWQRTLAGDHPPALILRQALLKMRSNVEILAAEIASDLPSYTVHDVTHLDALWGVADTIAGPSFPLNPLEAFCLGAAFLVHDLGMGLAAWPGRENGLRNHPRWPDIHAAEVLRNPDASSTPQAERSVVQELLRLLHAEHAGRLLDIHWIDDEDGGRHHLLEDSSLRFHLGEFVGRIAHSHWWSLDQVARELNVQLNPPAAFPKEWTIDPLKVACLLRAADAAHVDERRAPRLLRAARNITGISRDHWVFQGHLGQPRRSDDWLVYTAGRSFPKSEARAWWLALDTLRMIDTELRTVDALLADLDKPRFAAKGVLGVDSPIRLAKHIPTLGWLPVDASVKISNVPGLVRKLGGSGLYGPDSSVPLRELLQNASDAVTARRLQEGLSANWGRINVTYRQIAEEHWIEVSDTGVGMSESLITGPLLDFGTSYWDSSLAMREHPGLASKGFTPTGSFGIGFFSVFMWGDSVIVKSRRPEDAVQQTRVLEFEEGPSSRPLLRPAAPNEQMLEPGTSVKVRLRVPPAAEGGLFYELAGDSRLAVVVGRCAPASPVDIFVTDGTSETQQVVEANDWLVLNAERLIGRIAGYRTPVALDRFRSWIEHCEGQLSIVSDEDGRMLGRIAMVPRFRSAPGSRWHRSFTPGVVTAGGFGTRTAMDMMAGILLGTPESASRQAAHPYAGPEPMRNWAEQQARRLEVSQFVESEDAADLANVLISLGAEPGRLPIANSATGWLNVSEVAALVAPLDTVVWVSTANIFLSTREDGELRLEPNVLVSDSGQPGLLVGVIPGDPRKGLSWPTDRGPSLSELVQRIIATAWGLLETELVENSDISSDERSFVALVGEFDGRPLNLRGANVFRRQRMVEH